jgi:hypothetical protein
LEVGVVVGLILIVLGMIGTVAAVLDWSSATFGPLDPERVMRLVIPSVLGLTLGCEVVLVSFFLSLLGLRIRRLEKVIR